MEDEEEVRIRGDDLARLVEVLSQAIAQAAVAVDLVRRTLSSRGTSRASHRQPELHHEYSREVHRAMRYIEAHYEEDISLARLARVADCSRRHLAAAFRRETGETVHNHLVRVRLRRAALHVRAGDKIEAVMLGVGFRGKRNFYRLFKAQYGATPDAYRHGGRGRRRVGAGATEATPDEANAHEAATPAESLRGESNGDWRREVLPQAFDHGDVRRAVDDDEPVA